MTKIAILGSTSQIARDLIVSFSSDASIVLYLYARQPEKVTKWLATVGLSGRYLVDEFSGFAKHDFDAVINFVGAGDPAQIAAMGNSIFDVTLRFDELILDYLKTHSACRYLFLSSGAAYGSCFNEPATRDTKAVVPINSVAPHDWYGAAKLHAECRHRAYSELPIVDIRVFNYFSCTQDAAARFLITDILRAIRDKVTLQISPDPIVRDFLHPSDFYRLVSALISSPPANAAVDCYSRAPISKAELLEAMQNRFGLRYEVARTNASVNATGSKPHYYSLNARAAEFGYQPGLTSLEGITIEFKKTLSPLVEEQN
jgi:nucleoside-diphosphate-sugar epimerase